MASFAPLALIAGLYLCHIYEYRRVSIGRTLNSLGQSSSLTNDCIRHAQDLYSKQVHDTDINSKVTDFNDDMVATITEMDKKLGDPMSLNTSVYLSTCQPMSLALRAEDLPDLPLLELSSRPPSKQYNAKLQASIADFVQYTPPEMVEQCLHSIEMTVQQHTYLQKLSEAVGARGLDAVCDLVDRQLVKRQRRIDDLWFDRTLEFRSFFRLLGTWTEGNVGVGEFLVGMRELLLEEKVGAAKDAAAGTGLFGGYIHALLARVYKFRHSV